MKKINPKDDRRGGFYWRDEKPFVSVTHILRIIDKPALRYWFGKQVYYAMVKDPSLSEKDALSAPYSESGKAKSRGSTVHSIVEAYSKNRVRIKDVVEEFRGYAKAFYKFVDDNNVEILAHEQTVLNEEHRYAGTLDLEAKMGGTDDHWVLDVKTGKDIYPEAGLQLSAYKHALDNGSKHRIGVILLGEKGTYKFEEMEDVFDAFLHAKALWEWNNKDLLIDVGYLGGGEK